MAVPAEAGDGGAPPPALGAVEVLKSGGARIWYCGRVVGVGRNKDSLSVAFEGDVWQQADFPFGQVRKPPKSRSEDIDRFDPKIGDEVELRVTATEHAPAGWATAVVKKIRHDFYYVARSSGQSGEAIVEKDCLRPVTQASQFVTSALQQETYKLPPGLHSWMSTADAHGCFCHIEEQASLTFIHVQKDGLKLYGDAKAILRAQKLLEVHVKHQVRIQDFQDKRERGLKALETKRSRIEGTGYKHSVELRVDPSFIPRIIGKGGETIRGLQDKYDVNVRIVDSDDTEAERVVRIFGNSQESIDAARAEIEFVEEALDVEPEMYSWVLGRGGKTIRGFKDSCALIYATLDRDKQQLLLCGTRAAVQEAVAMFETHIMYFPVFHQMDEEMGQILTQLEDYGDYNARWEWSWVRDEEQEWASSGGGGGGEKGGGKRDGKAKGKGKSSSGGKGQSESRSEAKDSGGKGGKDTAKGKDKDRPKETAGGKDGKEAKDGKGKGKNGKPTRTWVATPKEPADEEDEEDEDEEEEAPRKGKAGKKGAKGAKSSGKGKWRAKDEEEDEGEDEEESEEDELPARKGAGRSKGSGRGGRAAAVSGRSAEGAAEGAGPKPGGAAPSGRRMGKKGLRS